MAIHFFDSSALVKRYVSEIGSVWIQKITASTSGNLLYIARITCVEVVAAISRRIKTGSITASDATTAINQFKQDLIQDYRIIELTPTLATEAMLLAENHSLRGYDAVQLASALAIHRQLSALGVVSASFPFTLISADSDLNDAAQIESLTIDDPNNHP